MSATTKTANSLSHKLQTFRETLPNDEKLALDTVLIYFNNKVHDSEGGAALLKTPSGTQILEEMKKSLPLTPVGQPLITPTITTITITTILASHPIITCAIAFHPIQGSIRTK